MSIIQVKEILKRVAAMVVLKVSGVLAIGSVAGVEPVKNAMIAAGVGILEVLEELSKSYMNDGYISDDEINAAFAKQAGAEEAPVVAEDENLG
jgi:hypothetical protein